MAEEISEEQRKAMEEKLKNMSPEEIAELQKQQCIFCQIISGKIPSKKVYEDDICIVVLDINPAASGHCLLLPKQHYAIMPQVPENELNHMFKVSKAMSQILLKSMRAEGTNIFVANGAAAGQKAPHFMIHLIPRKDGDGLFNYDTKIIESEVRTKIEQAVGIRLKQLMGIETQTQLSEHEEHEQEGSEPEEVDSEDHDETNENEDTGKIEKLDDLAGPSEESQEDGDEADQAEDDGSGDDDNEEDSGDHDDEGRDEDDDYGDEEDNDDDEKDDEEDEGEDESDNQIEHEPNEDEIDASLDEIANLFK